ncbi:Uncharacterised protein [Mycobacteroides abscessus subsp. abscessus]|nr:Uncharacterised protein [Mycobacteroides abscessus subsp. abscessus]
MKIFIVEDDLVIAESLANELSKWNYEVHVVDNFEKIMEDLMCLLCLLVQEQIIWIKFWLSKWVAMILSRNHLTCL